MRLERILQAIIITATVAMLWLLLTGAEVNAENPPCPKRAQRLDGLGGFLWKPESDSGGLVVLFPKEYAEKFKWVRVYRKGKKKAYKRAERLRFTGVANGNRQHWRGWLHGGEYTGRIRVKDGDRVCRWKVQNSRERAD